MNSKVKTIINIIGFYIGWWACVLGTANDNLYLGPAAFFTGEKFGAIEFNLSILLSGLVIATVYGIAMPLIYFINRYLGLDE